ncbi:MAG TPA: hypothetical protein VMR66_12160, partial [Gemmatimonadota bacterium]|nr:hypothetical protein [Gemmatimonadota bacterium]
MTDLKPISRDAVPHALAKVERYRLLNEPADAESICRDVLRADPENQQAIVSLLLTLTDQFGQRSRVQEARLLIARLEDDYAREYYEGIVCERQGKALLRDPASAAGAHGWLEAAMAAYERAEALKPEGNDDAILRWNACARIQRDRGLGPRAEDAVE